MTTIIDYQLPATWETVKLGELAVHEKGKKPHNQFPNPTTLHPIPYIDIRAFEDGVISSWTNGLDCRICHESELLMVWDGARSGLVGMGKNGALGSTLVRLDFPLIENKYAFYFFQLKYQEINTRTKGSGTPHVDPDLLWNYEFPVPPIPEQRRIVAKIDELFSELDRGIESLNAARAKLDVYGQSVLKHSFEGKLTARWREENKDKLETSEQFLDRIKKEREKRYALQLQEWKAAVKAWDEEGKSGKRPVRPKKPEQIPHLSLTETETLPTQPAGWTYIRLGHVIDEPKYGSSKKCDYDYKGTGVLRIPNVVRGAVDTSDLKGAHFAEDEKLAYGLRSGDILVIRSNGSISIVGRCALVSKTEEQYLYAGYLIRLRVNMAVLNPEYLVALLSSHLLRTQIEHKAKSTSGVNNINSGEIQSLIVPLCSLSEQEVVVERLSESLSSINAIKSEIDSQLIKVQALRQCILKKAISGQLVPQDLDDEPASILIEHIKEVKAARSQINKRTKRRREKATA